MFVTGHQLSHRHQPALDRVHHIATPAARLVEQHLRARLPLVHLAVATTAGMHQLSKEAHRELLGPKAKGDRGMAHHYGLTTVRPGGVLVVINAQTCPEREIDKTVIHELVHVAQLTRPGRREEVLRGLRSNYRIAPISRDEADALNAKVDADEAEAERLEHLATKLR